MLTESTEGLEVTAVLEEVWPKGFCNVSRIVTANSQVPVVGLHLSHDEQQQQTKQNNMVLTTRIKTQRQGAFTGGYA